MIYTKDMRLEFRSKNALLSMIFFAFLLLVILNMAVGTGKKIDPEMAAGILVVAVVFASILGQSKIFSVEKENHCLEALLISPVSVESIFAGKVAVNFTFMVISEAVIFPLFFVLYGDIYATRLPSLLLVFFLLNLGFSTVGVLFSAIAEGSGKKEFLLPVLVFPALIPVVLGAVKVTGGLFFGKELSELKDSLYLLVAFDLIFLGVCSLLFGYVVREN